MSVITDRGDVVVNVRVDVRFALFVVVSSLDHVKEVGDNAAGRKALAFIVEIETPRVGEASRKHLEFVLGRMIAPDAAIDKLPFVFFVTRLAHH